MFFANFWSEDLVPINCLHSELNLLFTHWENLSTTIDLANSAAAILKMVDPTAFPNVSISLRLLGTLPVTTSECEKSFSSLRHIKTWSWSAMEKSRITVPCNIHTGKLTYQLMKLLIGLQKRGVNSFQIMCLNHSLLGYPKLCGTTNLFSGRYCLIFHFCH